MARAVSYGFVELDQMLNKLTNIPDDTKNKMLEAAAKEYKDHVQKSAGRMIKPGTAKNRKGSYSTGYTRDNVITRKRKGAYYVTWLYIVRHREEVRANEIAFLTEYGVPRRGIPARPFIQTAVKEGYDDAYDAAMGELNKFLETI